jgi:hypothetical protein
MSQNSLKEIYEIFISYKTIKIFCIHFNENLFCENKFILSIGFLEL